MEKIFGFPAKTVENNFFFVSSVADDGRLRRRRRRKFWISCEDGEDGIFLYLLRMIRASSRKKKDNFLNLFEEKDG